MAEKYYTVLEIANIYGVTPPSVRYWLSKGLPHTTERVIGKKRRVIIKLKDVEKFLNLGKK